MKLLLLLLFCEVHAVISGPAQSPPGDLVVLHSTESVGDNYKWVAPPGLQTLECSGNLAFATGKPGTYTFLLIAADKEAAIDVASHTVTVGSPPENPADPTPTPATDFAKISSETAPDDKATAAQIISYIDLAEEFIVKNKLDIDAARSLYKTNIGLALSLRPRGSQTDWTNWRKALEAKFQEVLPTDVEVLIGAYKQVSLGLQTLIKETENV